MSKEGRQMADHTCLIVAMREIRAYVELNDLQDALGPIDLACAAVARVVEGQPNQFESEVDNLTASNLIFALLEDHNQIHAFPYPRRLSGRRKKAV